MIGIIIGVIIMCIALKLSSKAMNANTFDFYDKMKESWASGHKMKAVGFCFLTILGIIIDGTCAGLALLVFWILFGCVVINHDD